MEIIRHGDVNLHRVEKVEDGEIIKHNGSFVLALGEVTGHSHVLVVPNLDDMTIIKTAAGFVLNLTAEGTITHEEHRTLKVPPGKYFVGHEREYDWFGLKTTRVVD